MGTINPAVAITDENSLQPFFILHKATRSARESSGKSRRMPKVSQKCNDSNIQGTDGVELRLQSFHFLWTRIESVIQDVLRSINSDAFDKIACWIHESFDAIRSCRLPEPTKATKTYPLLLPTSFKQLFTALVFTNNMEFVDDIQTFGDLAQQLKSHGCHVANLSSLDFSSKLGVGCCLRSLLRQFLMSSTDACDISILASWYCEQGNYESPIVVIIDGIERCCGSVLSDFIVILSEWVSKIPILIILGVTTTTDAIRDLIPSSVLSCLFLSKFILGSPIERMDRVIEAVLVKHCSYFSLGHKVATFLRNYFLMHDGTLISFIRALKMASFQHFVLQSPSFTFTGLMEEFSQDLSKENTALIQERTTTKACSLQCHKRNNPVEPNDDIGGHRFSEMQRQCNNWASLVMILRVPSRSAAANGLKHDTIVVSFASFPSATCLYEAGKCQKVTLLDLYCAVLDPQTFKSRTSVEKFELEYNNCKSSTRHLLGQHPCTQKCSCISQAIYGVRDLPAVDLYPLLGIWAKLTEGLGEMHEKIEELKSFMLNRMPFSMELADISKKHTTQSNINLEKDTTLFQKKASELASCMVREYMQPIECIPLHEIVCCKNADKLQSALMGDPRRRVQVDLLDSQKFLKCSCCKRNEIMLPSMHDTSVMYNLAQEHGDLINLHDMYQSFKATISNSSMRTKNRLKQAQSPKKRKTSSEPQSISDASIQARFCRAVAELQITGLLRMPSKRRPDFVQRVAFGV